MTSLVARQLAIPGRLSPTDLTAAPGEAIAVVGPNGGGKTSLLRALARVERAAGTVSIAGEDVDEALPARRRRLLAYLPASRELSWPIAARDVIALGLDRPDPRRVETLIETFELGPLAERRVDRLSTGERARVLTARALAAQPRVLLLDEPMSNLDPYWVLRLVDILDAYRNGGGIVLAALHDLALLPRFGRALLVDGGRVQADQPPADLVASARFERVFRVSPADAGGWRLSPSADPRSSP
jgi:iron complex transport system ATP-binding protein